MASSWHCAKVKVTKSKREMRFLVCLVVTLSAVCLVQIDAHGMMLSPPSRSSRWRFDSSAPTNWNDNELFCGGLFVQSGNGGNCGLCGDNFAAPQPRPNEIGGQYGGHGAITKTYWNAPTAQITVRVTTNHLGYFAFHLCNLDEYGHESEDCFNRHQLRLPDGNDRMYIGSASGEVEATVVLPAGLNCQHCVLRWTYVGANNWGYCGDGTGALGCGPQETFKNCADVSIFSGRSAANADDEASQMLNVLGNIVKKFESEPKEV